MAVVAVPCEKHGEQVAYVHAFTSSSLRDVERRLICATCRAVVVLHPPSHPSRASTTLPPPTEPDLQSLVASRLPKHCIPAMILFPSEWDTQEGLPKNATGKVLKNDVKSVARREWERRGLGGKDAGVKAKL